MTNKKKLVLSILLCLSLFSFVRNYSSFWSFSGKHVFSSIDSKNSVENISLEKKVAIIGGAGYIGTSLALFLQSNGYEVTIFDMNPKIDKSIIFPIPVLKSHSNEIEKKVLSKFSTIIFLGGCTGRKSCDEITKQEIEIVNIKDVIHIMKQMSTSQHLIAASTSAVTEGLSGATENSAIKPDLLDSYSISMFKRETRIKEYFDHDEEKKLPQVSLLRFGTVVGSSPSQRTDLMFPSFFRSAYTTGILKVGGHNTMRSFLTLDDLKSAIHALISSRRNLLIPQFNVWNLASFNATVLKVAASIASVTGARIDTHSSSVHEKNALIEKRSGFSLNCQEFINKFNFTFRGTLERSLYEFDRNIPESIIPKGPHRIDENKKGEVVPCPVCGATGQQTILDLGSQPLANDFFPDINVAIARPRFPLKLVRCRVCNHYHLSHIVDRSDLFEHYLYQSGTSKTLSDYFEWLALKVIKESNLPSNNPGAILEIACNDGSQLDHYKSKGWKTYGVDPATNLAAIAARNHTVKNGFWPTDFPELPRGDSLTAITAQNVAAHVPDVVAFLKGCADVMGPKTLLYIQTSQCNMQQLGQFDTVYHEHVSFFTGHSFMKAAELSGLVVKSFETTPIHGESCLVTMQLDDTGHKEKEQISFSLQNRLNLEVEDGITSEFFAIKFSAHAQMIRDWVKEELLHYKSKGSVVAGYGAAAKGMVLLHFILGEENYGSTYLDFILDDAKLKQNTFCPGTTLPVKPTSSLLQMSEGSKPLVVVVFAWNFFDEIAKKIKSILKGKLKEVTFLVPFPSPRIIKVNLEIEDIEFEVVREFSFEPSLFPNPITHEENRTKAIMITHQRNEELLMPFFIMQHAPMFDEVILIDFKSDDRTLEIIERFAPPSWKVIESTTGEVFDARKTDQQVMSVEKLYPHDWIIALCTTEFLVRNQLRQYLKKIESSKSHKDSPAVSKIPSWEISANNSRPLVYSLPLPIQRHTGMFSSLSSRFLHYGTSETYHYGTGRHTYVGNGADVFTLDVIILKFMFAPWPEVKERKMNVGKTIPASDVRIKAGYHHTARLNVTYLENEYKQTQLKYEKSPHVTNFCDELGSSSETHKTIFNQMFGRCKY